VILRAVIYHRTTRRQTILVQSRIIGRTTDPDHTAPYGADPIMDRSLAVNCQATIIQSLRDKRRWRAVDNSHRLGRVAVFIQGNQRVSFPRSKRATFDVEIK